MSQSLEKPTTTEQYVRVAKTTDVQTAGYLTVYAKGIAIALFSENNQIYAIDNRCPHMGFPLHRGTVKDCILTCHWHHARFDLASGGTFDAWADDVRAFPVEIRDGEVWVNLAPQIDAIAHQRQRLQDGLQQSISLVIAKSIIALLDAEIEPTEPFRIGLDFGARYRQAGWGAGLTILTSMMNLLPYLDTEDRPRALYHGLAAVARECAGAPPRFPIHPLPNFKVKSEEAGRMPAPLSTDAGRMPAPLSTDAGKMPAPHLNDRGQDARTTGKMPAPLLNDRGQDARTTGRMPALQNWFRQFIEVRDAEGAERCLVSAIRAGCDRVSIAEMLFTAATDSRYIDTGHALDFTNKALEALDATNWQDAELVLSSLVRGYANAERMEESNSWRYPVDLVAILQKAFEALPGALEEGKNKRGHWNDRERLMTILLGEDAEAIAHSLLEALRAGCTEEQLAGAVAYAAALRIAHFHTNNEFGDWDTAHHTFTFANAMHQGMRRIASAALLRGVFDAAMSVYLDRFLNVPAARLPSAEKTVENPDELLQELPALLDRQQQVNQAGELVARYLYSGGKPERLLATIGKLLLREDRDFHTIQEIEAAFRQYALLRDTPAGIHVLVAAARYLAAHAPTMRSQGQTYQMAHRLHRGDRLFEDS